jgi:hypothetical protein
VWRFRCVDCGKTFTRLPSFLFPFKHYVVKEIEGVMRHLCDGGQLSQAPSAAEESTLHRWWKEYSAKMREWAGLLESRIYEPYCNHPSIINLSIHPLKRLEAILSRLQPLPPRWPVMIKILYWLNISHSLCLSSPLGHVINWCQILEKGVDTS